MAAKKAAKNEVSVGGQFTLDSVPDLLAKVEAEMDALKAKFGGDSDETPANGELEPFGNLNDVNDISTLISAYSLITGRSIAYERAAKALGQDIKKHPFKEGGASLDKWEKFINRRIGEVTYKDKMDKLKATREKLKKYVSEEQQFQSDMKDIADILS